MQYRDGARLDPSQMGSKSGRGTVAVGGGVSIIVLLIAMFLGISPDALGGLVGGAQPQQQEQQQGPSGYEHCTDAGAVAEHPECRWVVYTNSVQSYWSSALRGYQLGTTQTFSGTIQTGCGTANSQIGPFYCPADHTVYLDPTFFEQMLQGQLGAKGGDAAEAYVIAHEYGHHVQNLTGTLGQVQQSGQSAGPNSPQVALELQADCYAGVWMAHATAAPDSPIAAITQDDINRAVDAAVTVGDDRIQRKQTGQVRPDQWTHGSSAQRQKWLARGFNTGDPNVCSEPFNNVR